MSSRLEILRKLKANRALAHEVLFKHRHPQASPPFHREMVAGWHSPAKGVLYKVFRGAGKSTLAEEAILIMAGLREFRNCLIIGENYDRAAARLHAVRREIETNDRLERAFGPLRGPSWGDDRLVLSTGAAIQALGKGQSLRGIKHEDMRPDLVFGDDLENRDDCKTPEQRKKTHDWFMLDLEPALDPSAHMRVAATPLHPESLCETLAKDGTEDLDEAVATGRWLVHKYPMYYSDPLTGEKVSSWPERFPLADIERMEANYHSRGAVQGFRQEFMCESEAPETKAFKRDMMSVEPQVRTWQAVYSMTDPARTVNRNSADTGRVVWSWIRGKLVVWDAVGAQWTPSDIVEDLFKVWGDYHPTWMGFEEDGLNLWASQAIRAEQVKRGVVLPYKAMKAPRGKLDFIRGLQPFFNAREVVFAKPLPDLQNQLMGFPNGKIDVPNALAYAIAMRPGAPVYDDFSARHCGEGLRPLPGRPVWLCLNATGHAVTGVLAQQIDGALRIFADYVREGDPAAEVGQLIRDATLDAGAKPRITMGPRHFSTYDNVGLAQAVRKLPMDIEPGLPPERGRNQVRALLQREKSGMPMLLVTDAARWTLNAFAGGYARVLLKAGVLADYAEEGVYRTLMEGLESFAGKLELGYSTGEEADATFNAVTHDGRPYRSMLGAR
jgi:hypothetical protein